jgi:predicted transposase/invertase (TIGR01784 family)
MSKKLHNPHDTFVKNLLSYPDSAAAFLQEALPSALVQMCVLEKLVHIPTSYTTPDLDKLISDIVLKVPLADGKDEITISVLIEHKSSVDHLTCLQLLTYIANGYDLQRKQKEPFSVIVPVIYYHGKGNWKFRPLHQLFKQIPDSLVPYIPTFHIEMLQIQSLSKEHIHNIAETKLRASFMVQKGIHNQIVAIEDYASVINSLAPYEKGNFLHSFFVYVFEVAIFEEETIMNIINQLDTNMKEQSMTLKDKFIARGKNEGIAIGIEKGIEQGIEKGRQEGMQKGSIESRYEFARKLIQRNMPLADICDLTGLTEEQVKGIKA